METLQRTANRGSISTGYDIDNSVKLEDGNNEWFYRASPTEGNRRTFTFSFWIKRTELGAVNASGNAYVIGQGQHGRMYFGSDYFQFRFDDGHDVRDITTKHRDPSAWLHVVVAVDTNQVSSSNRVKIYFNGVQTTTIDHDGGSYPDIEDQSSGWFTTNYLTLGTAPFGGSYNAGDGDYDMSGYLAEFCAVDGQQLAPTDFGEFDSDSGIWKPKDVSEIDFGSEGYYLDFESSGSLGADSSGNGNDFTENNITAADQATDTPTNNFTTWNTVRLFNQGVISFKEGGTVVINSFNGGWSAVNNNIRMGKGKWYAEFEVTASGNLLMNGNVDADYIDNSINAAFYLGSLTDKTAGAGYYSSGTVGNDTINYEGTFTSSGVTTSAGDIISVAIDCDNNKVHFAVNGSWTNSSDPATNTNGFAMTDNEQYFALASIGVRDYKANFGGFTTSTISSAASDANGYGTFEYAPPSGYYALCTKNLAEYG